METPLDREFKRLSPAPKTDELGAEFERNEVEFGGLDGGISAADKIALLAPLNKVRAAADAPDAIFEAFEVVDVFVPVCIECKLGVLFDVDKCEDELEDDVEKDESPADGIDEDADAIGELTSSSSAAPIAKPAASFNVSSWVTSPPPLII